MSAAVLLFDGHVPGDPALENSHFIAERTRDRLGEDAVTLTHPQAVRAHLEAALGVPTIRGVSLFGHGDAGHLHTALRTGHSSRAALDEVSEAGAVYGSDGEPALDLRNLPLLAGRWCHALACNVGFSLAHRAVDAGAVCFVAYETALTPEYDPSTLPARLHEILAAIVTSTTFQLHAGAREVSILQRHVLGFVEEMEEWLDGPEGIAWLDGQDGYMQAAGLRGFANQLWRKIVVTTGASAS